MPEEPICKVLLTMEQKSIPVEVRGPHNIYDPYTGKKLEASFTPSSYPMITTTEGIKWGQDFPGVYQIVIVPDEADVGVTVNGTTYFGVVAFYQIENRLSAVNWLSLDEMTSALLCANFLPRDAYQKEAIATYAIALRSLIYNQMETTTNPYWDVKAEDCAYQGRTVARVDAAFVDAMKATRKIVMTDGIQVPLTRKAIDVLREKLPPASVETMAKEGKDARMILHKFFPDSMLTICINRNVDKNERQD
jgi:stage II sporulation protein D